MTEEQREEFEDAEAAIILFAPTRKPWDGREVWDVMMSLGLRWGDMDLFHWDNEDPDQGDERLFSVCSTTKPGYFLPEAIAAGRLKVGGLQFWFGIARSADPVVVLESMLAAARYARKRLGGTLVDDDDEPIRPVALRKRVRTLAGAMEKAGYPPGSDAALRTF